MSVLSKNPNNVMLSVFFGNLPERDTMELWNLVSKVRADAFVTRKRILSDPDASRDRPYYDLQMQLAEFMQSDGDLHTCSVPVGDIDYGLYCRFSEQYGVDMNIDLLKAGSHVKECTDPTDPLYYNNMRAVISEGKIREQVFSHATAYGILSGHSVSLTEDDCMYNVAECYPKLKGMLTCIPDAQDTRSHDIADMCRDEAVSMDGFGSCFL